MKREEQLLHQALERLAMDETRQLEQNILFSDMQKAKALQEAHSKEALRVIRRNTRSLSPLPLLRTAAVVALIAGAVMLLRPSSSPLPPVPTGVPLQPYITSFPPTDEPMSQETPSPTSSPLPSVSPTIIPTFSPIPTVFTTPTPTISPLPSQSPSPMPTLSNAPDKQAAWPGTFFPAHQAEAWQLQQTGNAGELSAVLDDNYIFTEYGSSAAPMESGDGVTYRYVAVNGAPALLAEDKAGRLTLTWDQNGTTLSLHAPDGKEETLLQIAGSVVQVAP